MSKIQATGNSEQKKQKTREIITLTLGSGPGFFSERDVFLPARRPGRGRVDGARIEVFASVLESI
jgi:hypothetical protein